MNRSSIRISKPGAAAQFKTKPTKSEFLYPACTKHALWQLEEICNLATKWQFLVKPPGWKFLLYFFLLNLASFSWHTIKIEWDMALLILMVKILGQSYFSCPALPASKFPVKIKASWCAERSRGNQADESRDRTKPAIPMVQPFWASSEELGWETLQV